MADLNIDYDYLSRAILDTIDDNLHDSVDMDVVLKSASLCWDNTAIMVKSNNFTMIFDLVSYELMDYQGLDG